MLFDFRSPYLVENVVYVEIESLGLLLWWRGLASFSEELLSVFDMLTEILLGFVEFLGNMILILLGSINLCFR